MAEYKCAKCGFATDRERKPETCVYCGSKDSLAELEDAEQLLWGP